MQKTDTRTTVWVKRPRRKFMKQAIASCIRQNSSNSTQTSAWHSKEYSGERGVHSHEIWREVVQTLSHNWKYYFVMNRISDSKLHTKASSRIRKEHASGNGEELTHTSDDWWKANLWTKSWWERSKRTWRKSEGFLSKWSWRDDFFSFFWLSSSRGRSHSCSHARSSNYCVCDGVCTHTHLLPRTFSGVHTLRVHFAHSYACYTHAWLKGVCSAHVMSPLTHLLTSHVSPVLTYVLPCCSLTVTSRPLLEAQVKRTPHDELFGYLAKSAPSTEVMSPRSSTRSHLWTMTRRSLTISTTFSKFTGKTLDNSVFPQCLNSLFRTFLIGDFVSQRESKESMHTGKQLLDREEEKKEKVLWSVLQGWCQWKVDGTRIRSHSPTTHRQFDSDDRDLRVHLEWRAQQASLGENSAQKKDTRLNTTRRSKIRNEEIQNTQYLSHNENMKSQRRYFMCRSSSVWEDTFLKLIEDEESSSPGLLRKKLPRFWRVENTLLSGRKYWKTTKIGIIFLCRMMRNHVQSVYSSTILTYWAVVTDLRSSSSCYLEFVESFAAKLECHEIHKNIWGIPGNAFDCQHARRDPDASHNDSRNLATLLGILRTEGIEESESEEPSQSTPLFCS